MRFNVPRRWLFLFLFIAAPALAQLPVPLQMLASQAGNTLRVQNGATLSFSVPIGQSQTTKISATYIGTTQIEVNEPMVFGSAAFKATFSQGLPFKVNPGASFLFEIEFLPTDSALASAQFSLPFKETVPPTGGSTTPTTVLNTINFSLVGTAPSFVVSYVFQADQNVVPLQTGGAILYPATLVNTSAQAALNVTNLGTGAGVVTGISISGTAFRLAGLPLIPVTLAAGQTLQVFVIYRPTEVSADIGQITITFTGAPPVTINLQGTGTAASFVYQILQTDPPTSEVPGGTVVFDDTVAGQTRSVLVRVVNSGNANGTVSSITVTGLGFQLTTNTILPQTLAPNASLTLAVTFAPTAPGTLTGRLIVNSDTLILRGVGLGPRLEFSYLTGGTSIQLGQANSSVIFSPVMISQSAQVSLVIKNTGTQSASISNIGVGQAVSPFAVLELPALPVSLAPGAELVTKITFAPTVLGFSNGTLQVDATAIALVGSGTQPPRLPAYTIIGPGSTVAPATQPVIGLSLASPYSVAIAGTLTLGVSSNLPTDPGVQFSTGGRTVSFVIPANSTDGVFGNQGPRIGLQTGTVAGAMTLTPTFATQAGNVALDPSTPLVLQFAVASAPPVLIASQVRGQTANSFEIVLTGFSTTRTLTTCRLEFTPVAGVSTPTTQFTIDVQQIALAWFGSTTSQTFGGQFSMTIPVTLQGSVPSDQTLVSRIASVSISVNNERGASNTLQAKVQ